MIAELFSNNVKRATDRQLPVMELFGVAGTLQNAGETRLAEALYRTWIQHNTGDPLIQAVYFNLGVLLTALGQNDGARDVLTEAIRIAPDFYPPYINMGNVLERMGRAGDAVIMWGNLVNRLPTITGDNIGYKTSALKQMGRLLEHHNFDTQAEDVLRQSLEINSQQADVVQHYVSLRQRQCKWPVIVPWANVDRKTLLRGISSLSLAAYTDDPLHQLGNGYTYCRHTAGSATTSFVDRHEAIRTGPAPARRRIGYLSSDLREHAIGYLTSEIYELHDRNKVEVFAYYCGIKSPDLIQNRIKAAVEHWVDINDMNDVDAATRIADDGIEILIDVNGYTNGQRTKMLAMRPAPILVNWLGFPGTMGSPYHNYIIADDFIIPPEHELYYSEKVMRVPCYQANDRRRVVSPTVPTRAQAGLPDGAMVYCCFNGLHKFTPFTWSRWMSILAQVPDSVLWLLEGPKTTCDRLKELAKQAGIAPERIIFAPRMRNPDHLARYQLADLSIDSAPYGAHTTSSDALWMGIPVVTLAGRCFASRVCGSLVKSAGLPELVCTTSEQFVALAVELARDRPRLAALRQKLIAGRDTCVTFDMPLLTRSLENVYARMWDEFRAGKLPMPDLSNLDLYHELGVELDRDDVEMTAVEDYLGLYRRALADKARSLFLNPDPRLWPGPKA